MNFLRFFRWAVFLFLFFGVFIYFLLKWLSLPNMETAIWTGLLISFGNGLAGFALIAIGMRLTHSQFMVIVFGGMFFRILLIFSLLFILIRAFEMNYVALLISLLVTYFSFMVLEIIYLHKFSEKMGKKV